jgi:ABC-2 type transport system permease protein
MTIEGLDGAVTPELRPRVPFWHESMVFAERLLTRWRRNPLVPLQSLLFPTILLIVYYLLISKSMARLTGSDSIDTVTAMCALAGGMSGSLAAALSIPDERDNGLLSRFWIMPVGRGTALAGTLMAEAVRTLTATLIITLVGVLLGLRFSSPLAAVVFVLIPVAWVTVYATGIVAIALRIQSRAVLTWISTLSLGAVFGSAGVAPVESLPGWMREAAQLQPMSPTIQAMLALSREGFAVRPLLGTLSWVCLFGVIAGVLAVRGYRAAAQTGG